MLSHHQGSMVFQYAGEQNRQRKNQNFEVPEPAGEISDRQYNLKIGDYNNADVDARDSDRTPTLLNPLYPYTGRQACRHRMRLLFSITITRRPHSQTEWRSIE